MSQLHSISGDHKNLSRSGIYKRLQRQRRYAKGLTCLGQPRRNQRHSDLHGLKDEWLYNKLYAARYA